MNPLFSLINIIASTRLRLSYYRKRVSYRHKRAEWVLWLLLLSGVLLWNRLDIVWPLFRSGLFVHWLLGVVVFPITVGLFWWGHRGLFLHSQRARLKQTGRVIEGALITCYLSGLFLAFYGTTGNPLSGVVNYLHWASGLMLAPLVMYHGWRFTVVRWPQIKSLFRLQISKPTSFKPKDANAGLLLILVALAMLLASRAAYAMPTDNSTSLVVSDNGRMMFSANLWHGSITRVIRDRNNQVLNVQEVPLGQDIRRIAFNRTKQELAATDYLAGELVLLDAQSLKTRKRLQVGKRPFAVVYQVQFDRYWVTLFEDHEILLIKDGRIQNRFSTAETPRGLALTQDGRLLVTHAMTGEVSIYDATQAISQNQKSLSMLNRIQLATQQVEDEFVSQGLPRLLDNIAITPDGRYAWLPHVLWNFDHDFQFQSTVFPAISVLDLTPNQEQEIVEQRKQLFAAIDIQGKQGRTRIVSNPQSVAFSSNGKKAYVTLAGSDDLMVFDRSAEVNAHPFAAAGLNKRRHRKRQEDFGAKAIQIYRHTPTANPRGIFVEENSLWVQQAQQGQLSEFSTAQNSRLERVRLLNASWAQLVVDAASDTSPNPLAQGRALFHSARTDADPNYPIAGDFWMSCNSCHLDGFNFTNRYLMDAFKLDKKQEARGGHKQLSNMISGAPVKDLIQIIQDTQGGLGHDQRDGALMVDPNNPPPQVAERMQALHAFIKAPHNLPFNNSWVRLDTGRKAGNDDVAGTAHKSEWLNSAACAECHRDLYDQWADSNHRLMGESNPYFMVALQAAVDAEGEDFRQWCMGCHMPNNLLSGDFNIGQGHMFEKNGASLFTALENKKTDIDEGTGCLFCHRITAIEDAGGNGAYTVNLKDRPTYVGEPLAEKEDAGVIDGILNWLGKRQINADPQVHAQSYSQPFYKDPQLCKTCHNEFAPGTGASIVDTYGEWEQSAFNNPENPAQHRDCIDCHMHGDIQRIGEGIPGQSTTRGKVKDNVVTHQFTGANHHLVGLRNQQQADMSITLLKSSATLDVLLNEKQELVVRVNNVGAGHALPTGVADFRQFWLDVNVVDANGKTILSSGSVNEQGVVDANARMFMKEFGDEQGKPVGLLFWRYAKLLKDTRIPANGYRDEVFVLPNTSEGGPVYPLTVTSKLMYRIYPQWVTNAVRAQYPDLPEPPVLTLQENQRVFFR